MQNSQPESNQADLPMHYWMGVVTVYYTIGKIEKGRKLNLMYNASQPGLNILRLGEIQTLARKIFVQKYMKQSNFTGAKITDVVIDNAVYMGFMSDEELRAGINVSQE